MQLTPSRRLTVSLSESEQLKESGREYERIHYDTGDWRYNLKAIDAYEKAIQLDFGNQHAWANLAWCLWKQGEDNRALKCIKVAEDISPTSNQVRDVRRRIRSGKRSLQEFLQSASYEQLQ